MNEEQQEVQTPDVSGEEMKMPENSSLPVSEEAEESSVVGGPLLILLAILLVLILGGMYYWFSTLTASAPVAAPAEVTRPTAEENNEPESTTAEVQTEVLETVSTSDEIEIIEADLEATDLDSLDAELNAIDAELDAALSQ